MAEPCVLIVEPDILVRHPLAQYLRGCEFRVLVAASYDEARTHLGDPDNGIDIVLADIDHDEQGGFGFAGWLRHSHPSIEVLLTATLVKTVEKAGQMCRENPVIKKPFDHRHVLDHIKQLIAARERTAAKDDG
jgi:DNA-binding response OmpR family regulator